MPACRQSVRLCHGAYCTLLTCVQGCYAGAPNLARCRQGISHECKFIAMTNLKNDFPTQCKPDKMFNSAIGGITEYNSYAFGGAFKGRLFIAGYKKHAIRYNPNTGKQVTDKDDANYPSSPGLDMIHGPGGAHIIASFKKGQILINVPVDATVMNNGNPSVYDILPDRGMKVQRGPNTFIIGGANFNALNGACFYVSDTSDELQHISLARGKSYPVLARVGI